jgi:tRNA-2-methylthio-N6-dimethylallyladenosine synthase
MFTYSERPGTLAERKLEDDVPETVKSRRLSEIIALQLKHSEFRTKQYLNTTVEVLIERASKKSSEHWSGRSAQNIVAVFPKGNYNIGDFVNVKVTDCTKATLIGEAIGLSKNN